jgi:predicted NUDIX family phosphoesterase
MYTLENINEVIAKRDKYKRNSELWHKYNQIKNKLLYQKYEGERVLCIESKYLNLPEGFNKIDINLENAYFVERFKAEYNPLFKQIIPYIIVKYKTKYYVTRRLKGSGESRLVGLVACPGGHINPIDNSNNIVIKALERELKEELNIEPDMIEKVKYEGVIYSNADLVSQDHLGFVYTVILNTDDIEIGEPKSLVGEWMSKKKLNQLYDEMENWYRIVFDAIIR